MIESALGLLELVRVNPPYTEWFEDDLRALSRIQPDGIVLPKCECVDAVRSVAHFALQDHSGEQFIYLLEGEMDYVVGNQTFSLRPDDCLYFDAIQPHGPKLNKHQQVRYIVVFSTH